MDNLLAIDIHDDCVSGVLLEQEQKVTVVRGYGVASLRESSLAEAVADIIRKTGYEQGTCRIAIGAGKVFFRNLVLPFVDARKLAQILPFELEELTSFNLDDLHLDYLTTVGTHGGTEVVAAMVKKNALVDTLAQLAAGGIDPELFAVSGLQTAAALVATLPEEQQTFVVLDVGLRQATLILMDSGRIGLIRSLSVDSEKIAGFSLSLADAKVAVETPGQIPEIVRQLILPVQQTLISIGRSYFLDQHVPCFVDGSVGLYPPFFELLKSELALEVRPCNIAGRPLLKIEPAENLPWNPAVMNRALALAIWKRRDCTVFNFRTGGFKKQTSLKNLGKHLKAVALPLVLVGALVVGFLWWEYSDLSQRRDTLQNEITAVFHETLPEVTRVVNPVQQLKAKIDEARDVYRSGSQGREGKNKLTLLSELSSRIPQTLPVRITRLVAEQNDVRIMAETSDFNTVDNVKRGLEKSDLFSSVEISSANQAPKGGEVRFELKLGLK